MTPAVSCLVYLWRVPMSPGVTPRDGTSCVVSDLWRFLCPQEWPPEMTPAVCPAMVGKLRPWRRRRCPMAGRRRLRSRAPPDRCLSSRVSTAEHPDPEQTAPLPIGWSSVTRGGHAETAAPAGDTSPDGAWRSQAGKWMKLVDKLSQLLFNQNFLHQLCRCYTLQSFGCLA